jgi:hypothetical protein
MPPTTVVDAALDAVVPVTPRWRVALGFSAGVALLAAAAASASVLRPGVLPGSTSGAAQRPSSDVVLTTIELEGASAWQRVRSVTGPGVDAAWLTDAAPTDGDPYDDDPLDDDPPRAARTLPATLHRGERAWLVIRWDDPCAARATVQTVGVLGTTRDEELPDAFTPAGVLDGVSATCAAGS